MQQPREPQTLRLPSNRAFVVQFADDGSAEMLLRGRAEHLDSGQVAHFTSLGELGAFMEGVLGGLRAGDPGAEDRK